MSSAVSSTSSSSSYSIPFVPQTAPAGGLTITKPQQTATSYFKIAPDEHITFAWNLTSLYVMPTSLTLSAVCDNGNTYPVGPNNGIIPATQTEVVWDVYSYQTANPQVPLAQATYTLNIWDERGPGVRIKAGYFSPNSALKFALYTPQGYTALADGWSCKTCSGAMTYASHPAFVSLIISFFIIFFSGLHLLRNSARST